MKAVKQFLVLMILLSTVGTAFAEEDKLNFLERVYIDYKYDSTVSGLNNSNQTSSADADIRQFSISVVSNSTLDIKVSDPNAANITAHVIDNKIVLTDSSDFKYLFSVAIPYSAIEPFLANDSVRMTHINDLGVIDAVWNESVTNNSGYAVFENLPFSTNTIIPGSPTQRTVASTPQYSPDIPNWSFENWSDGTSNVAPDGWELGSIGESRSTINESGNYSYKITGDGVTDIIGMCTLDSNLSAGNYVASVWVKTDSNTGMCSVSFMDQTNWEWLGGIYQTGTHDWTYQETSFTVDAISPTIRLMATGTPSATDTFYFDNLVISKVYTPINATEDDSMSHLYQNFTWTPDISSGNAEFMTQFQSFDVLNGYTPQSVTVTIDGISKQAYVTKDGQIYFECGGLSLTPHNIHVDLIAPSINFMPNYDFESWANGLPVGYTSVTGQSGDEAGNIYQGTDAEQGTYCLELDGANKSITGHIDVKIPVTARLSHVSFWAKSTGVTSGGPQILLYNGAENYCYLPYINIPTWTHFDFYFDELDQCTDPINDVAFVDIYLAGDANTGSKWYIDNITVDQINNPSTSLLFSGQYWNIRNGPGAPLNNNWNMTGAFVDSNGHLHLTETYTSGIGWESSEIQAKNNTGYGTYTWVVEPGSFQMRFCQT